jgi:hypothetical protein
VQFVVADCMTEPLQLSWEQRIFNRVSFAPIMVHTLGPPDDIPPDRHHSLLTDENLTLEDISHLIGPETFSVWKTGCFVSKDVADALDRVQYAIVHRYSSPVTRDHDLEKYSAKLIDTAICGLALIRPTRKSRAMHVQGMLKDDGGLDAHGFSARAEQPDVPEIQKLFTIRKKDVGLLCKILPGLLTLYESQDYEPLKMAIQLYNEAYSIDYWKARHILWWSAIEALYGSNEDSAMARIYSFFGGKDMTVGYRASIYEVGDIPSCYYPPPAALHTLGEMVPLIYAVRNASAHGQKVPDSYFQKIPHPFGHAVFLDVLAETATFVIRKTVVDVLANGLANELKTAKDREDFWLLVHGLDKHQSKKRLRQMKTALDIK